MKEVFLKISQDSQETPAPEIFKNIFFTEHLWWLLLSILCFMELIIKILFIKTIFQYFNKI